MVNEDPQDKGTDLSEYARHRDPPPPPSSPFAGTGRFMRGFFRILLRAIAIMLGVAVLLILLVLGVCFIRV